MQQIIPPKLHKGDKIRVIAPSMSLSIISQKDRDTAIQQLSKLGLEVTFSKHAEERDTFQSSSIASRIEDLHEAFTNPNVKAILCATGGFNSNQLLSSIDWELLKNNPKILCGKSDITVLNNAIFAKTGVVSYSGPNLHSWDTTLFSDYMLSYFQKCLMSNAPFLVEPSNTWVDEIDSPSITKINNDGFWVIQEGEAEGIILGANMVTFALMKGTEYFPDLSNSILFLEDDYEEDAHHFDSNLQSILLEKTFSGVKGIIFGRFQKQSNISLETLREIIHTKKELQHLPIVGNVDFGHTYPQITFPVGGKVKLHVEKDHSSIEIVEH